ncbi:MAG TPA: hypothetical protein VNA25_21625 [Phycisphaerae bacterium]|nr:hypothetical protein [Phycisphaerae bacterium]
MSRSWAVGLVAALLGAPMAMGDSRIGSKGQVFVEGNAVIPLAVWVQPQYLFEYHRQLGMNCIIAPTRERAEFRLAHASPLAAATATGLGVVGSPRRGQQASRCMWGYNVAVARPGSMDRLKRSIQWARQRDPNRFVMFNIDIHEFLEGQSPEFFAEALKHTDAVISHVWPEVRDPNRPNIRNVATFVDLVRKHCKDRPGGEVSIWPDINPHRWHRKNSEGGTWYPSPSRAELRFQIWLALIHGADGVCFFPISFDPFVYAQIPAQNEAELAWNSKLIRRMTPALTADESPLKIEVSSDRKDGIVDTTTRQIGGKHYVFVLNGQREPQTMTLKVDGLGTKWQVRDAVEDKAVAASGGVLKVRLDGLALRIWELRPAPKPVSLKATARE